jgi:aryl-alcohol dehydrogenase-like predicted oxidoreductase
MEQREFGKSGLKVSPLGLGAGRIGDSSTGEKEIETFLNRILDSGVTLIDTARAYTQSEERIGKYLSHRRKEFVLSTKVGYGVEGTTDWTYECVKGGIERALRLLRTDYIDVVHLHSCPVQTLQQGGPVNALTEAVEHGSVRVAAYSGENEALLWAVESGRFGSVQHSISISDQRAIDQVLPKSRERGLGVIAKRPLANAPWRFAECPRGDYAEEYWWRWKTMDLDPRGLEWQELALRFSAFTYGVHSCVVGTHDLAHVLQNIAFIQKGPLSSDQYDAIRSAFKQKDPGWWYGEV